MTIFEVDSFKNKLSEECMPSNMADEEEDPVVHEVRLIFCCFKCIRLTKQVHFTCFSTFSAIFLVINTRNTMSVLLKYLRYYCTTCRQLQDNKQKFQIEVKKIVWNFFSVISLRFVLWSTRPLSNLRHDIPPKLSVPTGWVQPTVELVQFCDQTLRV